MTAAVYFKSRATAKRAISKYGRLVTWVQKQTVPVDPDNPFYGNTSTPTNYPVMVAFFPIDRFGKESQHFYGNTNAKEGEPEQVVGDEKGILVAEGFTPTMQDRVIRDGKELRIANITEIKPSDLSVIFIVEFLV